MSQPPYGPQQLDPSPAGPVPTDVLSSGEPGSGRSRTRRGVVVGAAVVGALVLGGAGYAVAAYLSGGGAQPEEALPADTMAVVKVDFDPALGQKTAVASLMEKFPTLGEGAGDIRQDLVDRLLELGDAQLGFAEDVEPWLGDRMAAALVPDARSDGGVAVVLVLAVDDQEAMGDTFREAEDDLGFGYAVRDDFLLLAGDQDTADRIAAQESRLSEDEQYAGDLAALAGDQLAVAWADLSAVQQQLQQAWGDDATSGLGGALAGRVVYGLHAEDDALELVGLDVSVSDVGPGPRPTAPTRLVQDLPEDTVVAFSASEIGDVLADRWNEVEATGMADGFGEMFPDLRLPEDLRTVFGSDFLIALRGDLENPQVGLRAVTDDPERATRIVTGLVEDLDLGIRAVPGSVDDGYVLATDAAAARALAGSEGGLRDSESFVAAVPAADEATVVGYVDLATLLAQAPESGTFDAADYEALRSLGFSVTPTDEGNRTVLRLTTG